VVLSFYVISNRQIELEIFLPLHFDSCQKLDAELLLTGKRAGKPYKKKRPGISFSENEIPAKGQRIPVLLLID